jgi:hypothetical protein
VVVVDYDVVVNVIMCHDYGFKLNEPEMNAAQVEKKTEHKQVILESALRRSY